MGSLIHCIFEQQAESKPNAVAVVDSSTWFTYGELNARANSLAEHLIKQGATSGAYVGLCMDRAPEMIASVLGILKSGASYVPLDPTYPDERLEYMLRDAQATIVVTDEANRPRCGSFASQARLVDATFVGMRKAVASNPNVQLPEHAVACLMYTSGSTGTPKGIMVPHHGIVRLVRDTDYCQFDADQVFLQLAPLAFDASTFEIWGPLLNGAKLALAAPGLPTLDSIGDAIRRYQVSTLWLTAGLFHLVVDECPEILRPIRQLLAGGDVLSPSRVTKALQSVDNGVVINGYGPTECTTFACCFPMSKGYVPQDSIPIGRPIANTPIYVVDDQLQAVPNGERGELLIGGPGVSHGYLNQPELTRERFITIPHLTGRNDRFYRTGDRVYLDPAGDLRFLGRMDNQVKVAGHRIEPGEIEAVLRRQPNIREAAVTARLLPSADKQLIAYFVRSDSQPISIPQLKKHLAEHLPAYMIPARFVELDRLPLNASGKTDWVLLSGEFDRDALNSRLKHDPIHRTSLGEDPPECVPLSASRHSSIQSEPRRELAMCDMTGEDDRNTMNASTDEIHAASPREKCIHELIQDQAEKTPNRIAVADDGTQLTYAQLNHESNKLASFLMRRGVKQRDLIGIYMHRSVDMLVSLLGVLKSGAAYVPLDPDFPRARLVMILEDAQPRLVLTERGLDDVLEYDSERIEFFENVKSEPNANSAGCVSPQCISGHLAYVMFTSGSTGRPKGVEIRHGAVVNLLSSMAKRPGMTCDDTLLAVTTFSFDMSVLELFLPLLVGGRVHIATGDQVVDGRALQQVLKDSEATVMQATPATWRMLVEAGWEGSPNLKLITGGEALSRQLADELLVRAESVWNGYGPTETTVYSSVCRVTSGGSAPPIGPPIDNTEFYVLDSHLKPVRFGLKGELYIGGDGLACGYHRSPELTAQKFIDLDFDGISSRRLYKTGDCVRARKDDSFDYLGRLDHQIKIRGFRIEIGEVESALKNCPGVRESVVVAHLNTRNESQLVGYLVPGEPRPTGSILRESLQEWLPTYMIPSFFVFLDSLPLTPNRKVDRGALAMRDPSEGQPEQEYVAPRNDNERLLAEICADVLGKGTVSVYDSLFDIGADSLMMSQIAARASNANLPLSPRQVAEKRTIAAICEGLSLEESFKTIASQSGPIPVNRDRYRKRQARIDSGNNESP